MEIDDIVVLKDPVKAGHLMVDKDMEEKVPPVFRGPDRRKPEEQVINGCPGFQLHNEVIFIIHFGSKVLRMAYGKTGIYFYSNRFFSHPVVLHSDE